MRIWAWGIFTVIRISSTLWVWCSRMRLKQHTIFAVSHFMPLTSTLDTKRNFLFWVLFLMSCCRTLLTRSIILEFIWIIRSKFLLIIASFWRTSFIIFMLTLLSNLSKIFISDLCSSAHVPINIWSLLPNFRHLKLHQRLFIILKLLLMLLILIVIEALLV